MYLPARVWSQQNQDSKFRTGVLHILAGHSGPETAADARTHFGIFSPQVWKLFPRDQVINLSFWDYNDVAPGYFAAAEIAAREKKVGVVVIEVARPDFRVADRSTFADPDLRAAAKGLYVIRDFAPAEPRHGHVVAQGSSATFNLVSVLPRLERAGVNVKVIAAISEELFDRQPEAYRNAVLPPAARPFHLVGVVEAVHRPESQRPAHIYSAMGGRRMSIAGELARFLASTNVTDLPPLALERARMVIASAAMGVDIVSSGERRLRARQRRADQRISHPGHGPARPDGAGIHDRSVQGIRDQVARALPPRLRRFGLREDNSLGRAGAAVPRHGTARGLPYRNVDISKFYPYGDVSFQQRSQPC